MGPKDKAQRQQDAAVWVCPTASLFFCQKLLLSYVGLYNVCCLLLVWVDWFRLFFFRSAAVSLFRAETELKQQLWETSRSFHFSNYRHWWLLILKCWHKKTTRTTCLSSVCFFVWIYIHLLPSWAWPGSTRFRRDKWRKKREKRRMHHEAVLLPALRPQNRQPETEPPTETGNRQGLNQEAKKWRRRRCQEL